MFSKLEAKTAVVTGAASGIGKAIAERFAAEGANVVVCDITDRGQDVVRAIAARAEARCFSRRIYGAKRMPPT